MKTSLHARVGDPREAHTGSFECRQGSGHGELGGPRVKLRGVAQKAIADTGVISPGKASTPDCGPRSCAASFGEPVAEQQLDKPEVGGANPSSPTTTVFPGSSARLEQRSRKAWVVGSIPTPGTILQTSSHEPSSFPL